MLPSVLDAIGETPLVDLARLTRSILCFVVELVGAAALAGQPITTHNTGFRAAGTRWGIARSSP